MLKMPATIDYGRDAWPTRIGARHLCLAGCGGLAHTDHAGVRDAVVKRGEQMPQIANPTLLGVGLLVLLIGIWMWRWSSRQVIDVKGMALGAAWDGVKKGQIPSVPDELKSRFTDIAAEKSNVGRAKKAGGTVARHFLGRMVGIASFIAVLVGLGLMAAGIWWK